MKALNAIRMGGVDVLPLVEGGKGVAVTDGETCGHWAASGGIGTFSAVNADSYDEDGRPIPQVYHGRTRRDRHEELVAYAISGGIAQAQQAHEINGGHGRSTRISCGRWARPNASSPVFWRVPRASSTA